MNKDELLAHLTVGSNMPLDVTLDTTSAKMLTMLLFKTKIVFCC